MPTLRPGHARLGRLPRAYEFVDGSAYLPHVERVRRARNAEVPESFYTDPLMYQATSAGFYGPRDAIKVISEEHGIDLEAEIVVITDDVPMGASPEQAAAHIQLIGLVNDVSLRNLIPAELAKGFGFVQSKPRSALSPVFVTPDELDDAWRDNKVHLPLVTHQRRLVRRARSWRGHAVQLRADCPCRQKSVVGRHDRGLGHHRQSGHHAGRLVFCRTARGGDLARRQAEHTVHGVRRHGADRDVRC